MSSVSPVAIPIVAIPALIGSLYVGYEKYAELVTADEMHEYVQTSTKPIQRDVNQMLSTQIAIQLQELYRARCNGYGNSNVDGMREDLESEYYRRTGRRYQPPSCQYLEVTQ